MYIDTVVLHTVAAPGGFLESSPGHKIVCSTMLGLVSLVNSGSAEVYSSLSVTLSDNYKHHLCLSIQTCQLRESTLRVLILTLRVH